MANAAQAKGAKYISGDAGHIQRLWYDQDGVCKGAIAANGQVHTADLVVVAAGASLPALVDGARTEVVAQTSAICVIQLEPHEVEKYRDIPIIDDFEQGKFSLFSRKLACSSHTKASSSPLMRTVSSSSAVYGW